MEPSTRLYAGAVGGVRHKPWKPPGKSFAHLMIIFSLLYFVKAPAVVRKEVTSYSKDVESKYRRQVMQVSQK